MYNGLEQSNQSLITHLLTNSKEKCTWGAEVQRILNEIFDVDSRPPCEAKNIMYKYANLVYENKWDSDEALNLRKEIDNLYGQKDPFVYELDLYIDNKKWEMSGFVDN